MSTADKGIHDFLQCIIVSTLSVVYSSHSAICSVDGCTCYRLPLDCVDWSLVVIIDCSIHEQYFQSLFLYEVYTKTAQWRHLNCSLVDHNLRGFYSRCKLVKLFKLRANGVISSKFLFLFRAEYWKSQPKKMCEFCKCWITDNKAVRFSIRLIKSLKIICLNRSLGE